jgi:hypothetical protein
MIVVNKGTVVIVREYMQEYEVYIIRGTEV